MKIASIIAQYRIRRERKRIWKQRQQRIHQNRDDFRRMLERVEQ